MINLIKSGNRSEPRVSTFDIFKLLGYSEHRALKRVIWENKSLFDKHGMIAPEPENKGNKKRGGQEKSYLLNLEQFMIISILSKNNDSNKNIKYSIIMQLTASLKDASLLAIIELIKTLDVTDIPLDRYVYVAKEELSGRYKIGISRSPEDRIKQLNTGNPEKLILVHAYLAIEQGNISENIAHSIFEESRLKGEWFESTIQLSLLPSYNCTAHTDGCLCKCYDCQSFSDALNYVDDGMSPYQAICSIVEGTKCSFLNAKKHVDAMIDTGRLS